MRLVLRLNVLHIITVIYLNHKLYLYIQQPKTHIIIFSLIHSPLLSAQREEEREKAELCLIICIDCLCKYFEDLIQPTSTIIIYNIPAIAGLAHPIPPECKKQDAPLTEAPCGGVFPEW